MEGVLASCHSATEPISNPDASNADPSPAHPSFLLSFRASKFLEYINGLGICSQMEESGSDLSLAAELWEGALIQSFIPVNTYWTWSMFQALIRHWGYREEFNEFWAFGKVTVQFGRCINKQAIVKWSRKGSTARGTGCPQEGCDLQGHFRNRAQHK